MAVWEDVEALNASDLPAEEKRRGRYRLKAVALADILNNGDPNVRPRIFPIVGTTFTIDTYSITLHSAAMGEIMGEAALVLNLTIREGTRIVGSPGDTHVIFNPPVVASGARRDLIEAGREIMRNLIRGVA